MKKVKKILWIDDMETWVLSAEFRLDSMKDPDRHILKIIHRFNGENIVQEIMQYDFDIIVMDYHMEPFNGDKYISDIRNEEHLQNIPIVFYSQDMSVDLQSVVQDTLNIEVCHRDGLLHLLAEKLLK